MEIKLTSPAFRVKTRKRGCNYVHHIMLLIPLKFNLFHILSLNFEKKVVFKFINLKIIGASRVIAGIVED